MYLMIYIYWQIYLYVKNPHETKYQLLINQIEAVGLKEFNNHRAFIEYSVDMDDIYEKIEEYDPHQERQVLIVFDDMISDMSSNKKLNPKVTELFYQS